MKKYKWQSIKTGEVVETFKEVLKASFFNFKVYHFIDIWKYKKEGF